MVYVNDIKCMSRLVNAPYQQVYVWKSWIRRCVGTHSWERGHIDEGLHLHRTRLQFLQNNCKKTDYNSMGIKSYLTQRAEKFLIDDSMDLLSFIYNTDMKQFYLINCMTN